MHIEKNFKKLLESISRKTENHLYVQYFDKWLWKHRSNLREQFLKKPLNFITIVMFLPFALGSSQFLLKKSTSTLSSPLFTETLPLLKEFQPQIDFETLEFIAKFNYFPTSTENTEVFSIKQPSLDSQNTTKVNFGNPQFIGTIKQGTFSNPKEFKKPTPLSSGNFYVLKNKVLDQLPSYLEGSVQSQSSNEHTTKVINRALFSNEKINEKKSLLQMTKSPFCPPNSRIKQQNNTTSFFSNAALDQILGFDTRSNKLVLVAPSTTQKKLSNNFLDIKKSLELTNQFYKDRLSFYKTSKELNSQLQLLFLEKNISEISQPIPKSDVVKTKTNFCDPNSDNNYLNSYLSEFLEDQKNDFIEKFLEDSHKHKISEDSASFRSMSGYKYPDTPQNSLDLLLLQNKVFGAVHLKPFRIQTSIFRVLSQNYRLNFLKLPEILIETKKIILKQSQPTKTLYRGPSLLLDSEKALDWKVHGKENLRSWCQIYLSAKNPLHNLQQNFFGLFYFPHPTTESATTQSLAVDWSPFTKNSFGSLRYSSNLQEYFFARPPLQTHFTKLKSSFYIPSELVEESFIRGLNLKRSTKEEQNPLSEQEFLPIIELQLPSFKTRSTKTDLVPLNTSFFNLDITGKLDYRIFPQQLQEKIKGTTLVSGNYIKRSSVFTPIQSVPSILSDNWEPITGNSWLILTQLSFAFFIFQILKALADNYGRELLGYLLDLVAFLGFLDDSLKQEIEILMGEREKGFRIILESKKTFSDLVGAKKILPEISEVVWFLRNSARDFPLSNTLPRGILLTGPPGTGKTLLVQAVAGEAQVPVIVLSGSSLIEPGESSASKLEMVFQEARNLAPCIIFIDEIDTLGYGRRGIIQNPMGEDELLESLTRSQTPILPVFKKELLPKAHVSGKAAEFDFLQESSQTETEQPISGISKPEHSSQEQLILLTQLLIELDGVQKREGVVVIGATNRPEVLDPALLRPGRFDKILEVGLPSYDKRIEILKFYSQKLGYNPQIPWNYFAERTAGFSAADLATLMNESTIKAILNQTHHTLESIEHGIDRLTTSLSENYTLVKLKNYSKNPLSNDLKTFTKRSKISILRLAYYQAGKILLSHLLETHPPLVVVSLWPRQPTLRSVQIATNLQNSILKFTRVREIQERLIGCYGGKAAEFLFLEKFSNSTASYRNNLSTLGLDDIVFAQKLSFCFIEKCFFYSKKTKLQRMVQLVENINIREFRHIPEKIEPYSQVLETVEQPPMIQAIEAETSSLVSIKTPETELSQTQQYYSIPWWQSQVSDEVEFVEKNFTNWSRIYLSNPEKTPRNPEWFPPDEFLHRSSSLKNVKVATLNLRNKNQLKERKDAQQFRELPPQNLKNQLKKSVKQNQSEFLKKNVYLSWNELPNMTRYYPIHSMVIQSFNEALKLLNKNREVLDRLVIELLLQEIIRQPDVEKLLQEVQKPSETTLPVPGKTLGTQKAVQIIESSWGKHSRKSVPRWIDFSRIGEQTT